MKRKFTGSCVPLGTLYGKILINGVDSKDVANAIRSLVKRGDTITIKVSDQTSEQLKKANIEYQIGELTDGQRFNILISKIFFNKRYSKFLNAVNNSTMSVDFAYRCYIKN